MKALVTVFVLSLSLPVLSSSYGQNWEAVGTVDLGFASEGAFTAQVHLDLVFNKLPQGWRHHRLSISYYNPDFIEFVFLYSADELPPSGAFTSIGYGKGVRDSKPWYFASLTAGPSIVFAPLSVGAQAHATFLLIFAKVLGVGLSATGHAGLGGTSWIGGALVAALKLWH